MSTFYDTEHINCVCKVKSGDCVGILLDTKTLHFDPFLLIL